jgi:hypothetical protein
MGVKVIAYLSHYNQCGDEQGWEQLNSIQRKKLVSKSLRTPPHFCVKHQRVPRQLYIFHRPQLYQLLVNPDNKFIEICRERNRNEEFGDVAKTLIVREVETGRSYRAVATDARTSPSTVYQIVQRWKTQRTLA